MLIVTSGAVLAKGELHQPTIPPQRALREYVRCHLNQEESDIQKELEVPVDAGADKRWSLLILDSCANSTMDGVTFEPYLMRAPVYGEMYRMRFGSDVTTTFPDVKVAYPVSTRVNDPIADYYRASINAGDCLVRLDPINARRMVLLEADSKGETAAYSELIKELPSCVADNQIQSLKPWIVGAMVAEPLYRLTAISQKTS